MLVAYAAYAMRDAALTAALAAPALAAVVVDAVLRRARGVSRRVAGEPDDAGAPERSRWTAVRPRAGVGSRRT